MSTTLVEVMRVFEGSNGEATQALYVELPQGQVSFHMGERGRGPDAPRTFDGQRGASPGRVCAFAARVLEAAAPPAAPETQAGRGLQPLDITRVLPGGNH